MAHNKIHAQIAYTTESMSISSDICPFVHTAYPLDDMEYRAFLHQCLDEWLTNSNGTGGFCIKNEQYSFHPILF